MNHSMLRTKLQRPRVAADILPRARLLDSLNEGRERALTLISAPAGYGKSTLASRWVEACGFPNGWVSLDESDSDLHTFMSYLLAVVRSLFPKIELRTEAVLEAIQAPSASVLARHLLNDLHQIAEPFILVLDDYHHIRDTSVHDLLSKVLTHPPQAMHLVLLTRRDPSLPISRLRGRGQMTEIRADDLRFTQTEAAAFLNKMLRVEVEDATATLLQEKTEGWVTGLRLAGLYLRGQDDLKRRVQELSGSSRHIMEYLVAEVLSIQNPEIAAYLIETSLLDRFSAPLCQAVYGRVVEGRTVEQEIDGQRFIEWLVEANIFVIPLDAEGYWFRYHHLFQEFLQAQLRKQTNADAIAGLHMRASNWFAEEGLIDEAIRHALAAGDTRAAIRLVLEHRYESMNSSQFRRLHRWLELLPKAAVHETPLLLSAQAFMGIEQGQDADVYTFTDQADRMLARISPESPEYAILKSEVNVLKGFIDMAVGRPDSGLAHTEEASGSLSVHAFLIRSLGILTLALCNQMKGNAGQAVKVITEELLNPAWPANILARIHFYGSIMHYLDANLAEAMSSSRECLRIVQDLPFTHTRFFASYLLGAAHYWRNELMEAESHLISVLEDFHASNPSYLSNAGFILACIYLALDCAGQAEQLLHRIGSHVQENGFTTIEAMARAFQVEFSLRQGDIRRASQLSRAVDFDVRPPIWFFYVPQLTPIKLLLADGKDESLKEAHSRLAELDKQMNSLNRKSVRIDVLALQALVCHKLGEEFAALEKLRTALALAEAGGWVRTFVDLGAPMRDLLERLIQADPGHAYAQQVLTACTEEAKRHGSAGPEAEKRADLSDPPLGFLTQREMELLPLVGDGLSNKEISERLFISEVTVKTHLQNIYRKLGAKGRIEALKRGRELGVIARP